MNLAHLYSIFVSTIAPFLLVTAIPSLLVALTPYPKAGGFLKALSVFAQLLSILTHRDSPGTLKMPLTATFGKTEEPTTARPSSSSLRALLPLAFLALSISGCATFGACELGKLGSDAQIAVATGQAIASNPGSTTADLETAALSFFPGQFECGLQALAAWWASKPATTVPDSTGVASALMAAVQDAQREHALDVIGRYLAVHRPVACGARAVL